MSNPFCAAVILAAGASRRLGQAKQLVKLDGEPLLRRAVRIADEVGCQPIIVVLGFEAHRMRSVLDGFRRLSLLMKTGALVWDRRCAVAWKPLCRPAFLQKTSCLWSATRFA